MQMGIFRPIISGCRRQIAKYRKYNPTSGSSRGAREMTYTLATASFVVGIWCDDTPVQDKHGRRWRVRPSGEWKEARPARN
jgi:hypothetical protein